LVLLLLSPLQAVTLSAETSRPARSIPELARQFPAFDRILVPTLGGFYLAITLLFPFIAIRLIAAEKASGGLKLLVQLSGSRREQQRAAGRPLRRRSGAACRCARLTAGTIHRPGLSKRIWSLIAGR
jgi:hypothetical protein